MTEATQTREPTSDEASLYLTLSELITAANKALFWVQKDSMGGQEAYVALRGAILVAEKVMHQ